MPAEGFQGHVATDGSLQGKTGKWGACGWAMVQLDYDEEMGPLRGMYGQVEAECEVQRTIKRPKLTAFLFLLNRVMCPTKCTLITKELLMDYGEREHQAKSGRCRFVDQNLGRTALSGRKGHFGGSGTCKGTPHEGRKEIFVAVCEGATSSLGKTSCLEPTILDRSGESRSCC